MPAATEIFSWRLAAAPWPPSRPVLAIVVEVLPTLEDPRVVIATTEL